MSAILVQRGTSRREESEGGHSIVRIDMRYMWSAMDSPWAMPKRRQPSRLVVFRRERRWKKGTGEAVLGWGRWERVRRTAEALR